MLHIQVRAVVEPVVLVVLVGRMQVDVARMAIAGEHALDALHRGAIESHVIQVNAVDSYVLRQPVHALHIVVVPAAHTRIDDRSILDFRYIPGGNVIVAQMLLQPGINPGPLPGEKISWPRLRSGKSS